MTNSIRTVSATTKFSHIQTIQLSSTLALPLATHSSTECPPACLHVFYSTLYGLIYICILCGIEMWAISYAFCDILLLGWCVHWMMMHMHVAMVRSMCSYSKLEHIIMFNVHALAGLYKCNIRIVCLIGEFHEWQRDGRGKKRGK